MDTDYIRKVGLSKSLFEEYANLHSTSFPGGSKIHYDQVLLATHNYLNEEVHDKVQARGELHDQGVYLTDHGPKHIQLVIRRASQLVQTDKSLRAEATGEPEYGSSLSPFEVFLLILAIHFHDVGNMYGREGHEQRIFEEMQKIGPLTIPWHQKAIISRIAACHGGTVDGSKDTIKSLPEGTEQDGEASYRPQLLAAVLRLADELADEYSRADNYALRDPKNLPETCLLYHKYAEGLRVAINALGGYVALKFTLAEADLRMPFKRQRADGTLEERFLLDEIYARTLKTYDELQYCARYMRSLETHLHEVRVEIVIYAHAKTSTPSSQLHYTIGDAEYPDHSGNEAQALAALARDFERLPKGAELAEMINSGKTLPTI